MNPNKVLFDSLRREARCQLKGKMFFAENGIVPFGVPLRNTKECRELKQKMLKTLTMKME